MLLRLLMFAAVVGLTTNPITRVSAQTPADSLRSLDSAWARTYATHDTTAGELADVRPAPNLKVAFFRTKEVSIRVYERTGIVTGLAEWQYTFEGRTSDVRRRYTSVFVPGGSLGWRMVALHIGRAPEPSR